jgi:hypothetical protein
MNFIYLFIYLLVNVETDHYNRLRYFHSITMLKSTTLKSSDLTHRCDFLECIVHLSLRVQCWIIIERIMCSCKQERKKERKVLTRFEHATCYDLYNLWTIYLFIYLLFIWIANWYMQFKKKLFYFKSWSKLYIFLKTKNWGYYFGQWK